MKAIEEVSGADPATLRDAIVRQAQTIRALELVTAAAIFRERAVRRELSALEDLVAMFGAHATTGERNPAVGEAFVLAVEVATTRHESRKKGNPP